MHARATIGFGFTSDWLKKWRVNFEQPLSEVMQNQRNSLITFDTQLKTALDTILLFREAPDWPVVIT